MRKVWYTRDRHGISQRNSIDIQGTAHRDREYDGDTSNSIDRQRTIQKYEEPHGETRNSTDKEQHRRTWKIMLRQRTAHREKKHQG